MLPAVVRVCLMVKDNYTYRELLKEDRRVVEVMLYLDRAQRKGK